MHTRKSSWRETGLGATRFFVFSGTEVGRLSMRFLKTAIRRGSYELRSIRVSITSAHFFSGETDGDQRNLDIKQETTVVTRFSKKIPLQTLLTN